MLLTEVLVDVFEVAEGQLRWVAVLTQGQVAYPFLYDVAMERERGGYIVGWGGGGGLLKDELVAFDAALGGRLGRELAEYLLRLRLVVGDVASRLCAETNGIYQTSLLNTCVLYLFILD